METRRRKYGAEMNMFSEDYQRRSGTVSAAAAVNGRRYLCHEDAEDEGGQ